MMAKTILVFHRYVNLNFERINNACGSIEMESIEIWLDSLEVIIWKVHLYSVT